MLFHVLYTLKYIKLLFWIFKIILNNDKINNTDKTFIFVAELNPMQAVHKSRWLWVQEQYVFKGFEYFKL